MTTVYFCCYKNSKLSLKNIVVNRIILQLLRFKIQLHIKSARQQYRDEKRAKNFIFFVPIDGINKI
jgi:hypothetical protein